MSRSYWGIIGYGVNLDDVPNLNSEKVNRLVRKINPLEKFEGDVLEDDTFCGGRYNSLAEFVCELDTTNSLTWDDGGDCGGQYVLYAPKYPWQVKDNDPRSIVDVEARLLTVLQKIYDVPINELKEKIGYISDYGCG